MVVSSVEKNPELVVEVPLEEMLEDNGRWVQIGAARLIPRELAPQGVGRSFGALAPVPLENIKVADTTTTTDRE